MKSHLSNTSAMYAAKIGAILAAGLVLVSLSERKAGAQIIVQYIAVVDENSNDLKVYSVDSIVDPNTHKTVIGVRETILHNLNQGKPGQVPTWTGEGTVTAGDIVLTEANNKGISDLIRFPPIRKNSPFSDTLQFYSDPDESGDVAPPASNTSISLPEVPLGKLTDILEQGPDGAALYDPKQYGYALDFTGDFGAIYRVKSADRTMPGSLNNQHKGPITYVFISDVPETSGWIIMAVGFAALVLWRMACQSRKIKAAS